MGFREEDHGCKVPFSSSHKPSTWFITTGVKFDHLAEIVFGRLLHYKLIPHFHTALFRGTRNVLKEWNGELCYINNLKLLCMGNLSALPHLFIQSRIFISMDWQMFISYLGLSSNTTVLYCSNCPSFAVGRFFNCHFLIVSLWHVSPSLCLIISLLSGSTRWSRFLMVLLAQTHGQ